MIVLRLLLTLLAEMIPRFPQGPFTSADQDAKYALEPPYPTVPPGGTLLSSALPLVESGAGAVGTDPLASHGDHVHPAAAALSPGLVGDIVAETINASASAGAVGKYADAGHRHAMPNNGAPTASAPGDAQVTGAAATFANSAHQHAREAFAAPTIALGTAAAAGAAATLIRSDATIAAFDATVPVTQAFGDAAATGVAGFAARRDHKHGMPASTALPGSELDYAQVTAPVTITATTTAGTLVVSGAAVTYDGATTIIISIFSPAIINNATASFCQPELFDNGVLLNAIAGNFGVSRQQTVYAEFRVTPSAGAHTYSWRAYVDASTATVQANDGTAGGYVPAFIRIVRV